MRRILIALVTITLPCALFAAFAHHQPTEGVKPVIVPAKAPPDDAKPTAVTIVVQNGRWDCTWMVCWVGPPEELHEAEVGPLELFVLTGEPGNWIVTTHRLDDGWSQTFCFVLQPGARLGLNLRNGLVEICPE